MQWNAYSLAEGLNITIIDKTDLKAVPCYLDALKKTLKQDVNFLDFAITQYGKDYPDQRDPDIREVYDNCQQTALVE